MTKLLLLAIPFTLLANDRGERIEQQSTETIPFVENGTLYVDDSFGEIHVEAWDRNDVEITIRRKTNRRYDRDDEWKGRSDLESIRIETRRFDNRLELRTRFPSRGLFRLFEGKTNIELRYRIRVPRKTHVRIRHGIGEVSVKGVDGEHDVTASIGEINLRLPTGVDFHFDARVKIGDVQSSFGHERREHLLGAAFRTPHRNTGHRVHARVGIGEIDIHRVRPD